MLEYTVTYGYFASIDRHIHRIDSNSKVLRGKFKYTNIRQYINLDLLNSVYSVCNMCVHPVLYAIPRYLGTEGTTVQLCVHTVLLLNLSTAVIM